MANQNVRTRAVLIATDTNGDTHKVGAILINQITGWEFMLMNPNFDYKSLPVPEGKTDVAISIVWMKHEHPNKTPKLLSAPDLTEEDFIPTATNTNSN